MSGTGKSIAGSSGRLHANDTAKGVGIILVVFGHAWRGGYDASLLPDEVLFRTVDNLIYTWHMPLFFLLSGLLYLNVLQKVAAGPFFASRFRRLLWPLAIWTWLFFGIKLLAGSAANHPVSLADFPLIPLPPYEHLWFLWALFLAQVIVLIAFMAVREVLNIAQMRLCLGITAVMLTLLIPFFYVPSPLFGAAIEHFPYFIAGMALGGVVHKRPPLWLALAAAVLFALLIYNTPYAWVSLLVSLLLTVLACSVIFRLDPNTEDASVPITLLRILGLYSLPIFLAHTIFSAAFRIALRSSGVEMLSVHLLVATLVGLIGPILLVWVSHRLHIGKILGF